MNSNPLFKILHVIPSLNPEEGGVCQALKTIVKGLTDMEVYNEVVSLDLTNANYISQLGFTVHALGSGKGIWKYNKRLIPWFMTNLTYFDAVIVHGLWSYVGYAVYRALKKLRNTSFGPILPKVLVMPHGMLDPYFQNTPSRRLKAFRNRIYWEVIEKKLINQADALLYTCEEEMVLANSPFQSYNPRATFVIGLGIEKPPAFTNEMKEAFELKCPGLNGAPYILFLGRLHEKKGIDLLVDAYFCILEKIEQDKTNIPVFGLMPKLVIAGPGIESPYGEKIKQQVKSKRSLHNMVIFTGMLSDESKWGALYGCEAFVLPSHQENFGISVVEALACSKPVLISMQINIWREINEVGGCYVSSDTLPGTIKLLEFWEQSSYKQRRAMSRNALYAFKKHFSIEPVATKLIKAVKEVSSKTSAHK